LNGEWSIVNAFPFAFLLLPFAFHLSVIQPSTIFCKFALQIKNDA
jgi:hypothetical protein